MPISQRRFTEIAHEAYREGFKDGYQSRNREILGQTGFTGEPPTGGMIRKGSLFGTVEDYKPSKRGGKRPRKLSKWQQFVKKNSKFPRFKYKSGAKKGRINLKALGVAYRKTKRR